MRAPITLDLHLPLFNFPGVGPEAVFEKTVEIARSAEDAGFSSVSFMDHFHQIPPVGPEELWMFDGNTMLAAVAARTEKVTLGLLVGGVTYRNPALHAKIATTLDIISGGRIWFGIGAAWFQSEHDAYGFAFPPLKERFEHLEDALRIARAMFTEERATVEGTHHSVRGAMNNPKPLRGDIPIVIGGSGERKTLRLVAQYADGCNVSGDVDHVRHLMGVLAGHCEDVGRDPAEITKTRVGSVVVGATHEAAQAKVQGLLEAGMPEDRVASFIVGDPDGVAEQAAAYRDAGIEGFTISVPDAHDPETIALIGKALGPVFA